MFFIVEKCFNFIHLFMCSAQVLFLSSLSIRFIIVRNVRFCPDFEVSADATDYSAPASVVLM